MRYAYGASASPVPAEIAKKAGKMLGFPSGDVVKILDASTAYYDKVSRQNLVAPPFSLWVVCAATDYFKSGAGSVVYPDDPTYPTFSAEIVAQIKNDAVLEVSADELAAMGSGCATAPAPKIRVPKKSSPPKGSRQTVSLPSTSAPTSLLEKPWFWAAVAGGVVVLGGVGYALLTKE